MLGKVKGGDTAVDFKAFRLAAATRSGVAPIDPRLYGAMVKANGEKKYKDALRAGR